MGENESLCPVDSWGRVREVSGLYVADASIIPDAPGVNPQGTVMALVLRNVHHFLEGYRAAPTRTAQRNRRSSEDGRSE